MKKIGPFALFGVNDASDLRALVVEVRRQLAEGQDAFIEARDVKEAADGNDVANGYGMMWETARDEYLKGFRKTGTRTPTAVIRAA